MARKSSRFGKKTGKQGELQPDGKEMGRFAGSSDEEGDATNTVHDPEGEESDIEEEAERGEDVSEDIDTIGQPFVTNDSVDDADPGQKMAGVMARILGTSTIASRASSVVLAKTTTPLQRLQQKEKEKLHIVKLKHQANRERNLSALHIPLSVATSINIDEGRISITKELEQERFHRRVATRGVVALFNAISQHQNSAGDDEIPVKKSDASKMTKHGFLDKIKSAATAIDTTNGKSKEKKTNENYENKQATATWDALKDDFMMKPKKNWDEESSDEDDSDLEQLEDIPERTEDEGPRNKRRKTRGVE